MKALVLILALLIARLAPAQLAESFSDRDFTNHPSWTGHTSFWQVVPSSDVAAGARASNTLRLNAPAGCGIHYLGTQLRGSWGLEQSWSFWMGRRTQAATADNALYFWLYASKLDVTGIKIDGYRVRFGDNLPSGDRIVVESVVDGTASPIINSNQFVPYGLTDYGFLVRVTRSAAGLWSLYTSVLPTSSGTGAIATDLPSPSNTPVFQGSATNTVLTNFDDGWIVLSAGHTDDYEARTGAEFDQISFLHNFLLTPDLTHLSHFSRIPRLCVYQHLFASPHQ